MKKKLCIFDLDGTLLNTIKDLGGACNYALQQFGFPQHAIEEYPHFVGNGVSKLIERALPEGHKDEETVIKVKRVFAEYYIDHCTEKTEPYPGIAALLSSLKKEGCKLAVASNKFQTATDKIIRFYFPDTFDTILGEGPNPRKPDPKMLIDIMQQNNCNPASTIHIGDSLTDIGAARAAGINVIACTWGFAPREIILAEQPDYKAENADEIKDLLLNPSPIFPQ